jgi:hypothetical protein
MRVLLHSVAPDRPRRGFSLPTPSRRSNAPIHSLRRWPGFQERVKAYISLRDKIAGTMPEVKETTTRQRSARASVPLGAAIAMERRAAKAGDVFGDLVPYLQGIIDQDWKTRSAADRKRSFEEIPPGLKLVVNEPYPSTIPLVTVPAKLVVAAADAARGGRVPADRAAPAAARSGRQHRRRCARRHSTVRSK